MLNKTNLKNGIKTLLDDMKTREEEGNAVFAERLSDLIDAYVRGAQVNIGIPVSTTGTAAAQTGFTTGIGSLS